jgi:hypothetical protein
VGEVENGASKGDAIGITGCFYFTFWDCTKNTKQFK